MKATRILTPTYPAFDSPTEAYTAAATYTVALHLLGYEEIQAEVRQTHCYRWNVVWSVAPYYAPRAVLDDLHWGTVEPCRVLDLFADALYRVTASVPLPSCYAGTPPGLDALEDLQNQGLPHSPPPLEVAIALIKTIQAEYQDHITYLAAGQVDLSDVPAQDGIALLLDKSEAMRREAI